MHKIMCKKYGFKYMNVTHFSSILHWRIFEIIFQIQNKHHFQSRIYYVHVSTSFFPTAGRRVLQQGKFFFFDERWRQIITSWQMALFENAVRMVEDVHPLPSPAQCTHPSPKKWIQHRGTTQTAPCIERQTEKIVIKIL